MTDEKLNELNEKMKIAFNLNREIHNLKDMLGLLEKGLDRVVISGDSSFYITFYGLVPEARDEIIKAMLKGMRWTLSDKEKEYKNLTI